MIKKITWRLSEASKRIMGEKWCEGKRMQVRRQRGAEAMWTGKVPEHMFNMLYGGPKQDYIYSAYDFIDVDGDVVIGVGR